jgi:hypothetical protein
MEVILALNGGLAVTVIVKKKYLILRALKKEHGRITTVIAKDCQEAISHIN